MHVAFAFSFQWGLTFHYVAARSANRLRSCCRQISLKLIFLHTSSFHTIVMHRAFPTDAVSQKKCWCPIWICLLLQLRWPTHEFKLFCSCALSQHFHQQKKKRFSSSPDTNWALRKWISALLRLSSVCLMRGNHKLWHFARSISVRSKWLFMAIDRWNKFLFADCLLIVVLLQFEHSTNAQRTMANESDSGNILALVHCQASRATCGPL